MKVNMGYVRQNIDETKMGIFYVSPCNSPELILKINLTSPFYADNKGGLISYPPIHSKIIYLEDTLNDTLYYFSTILSDDPYAGFQQNKKIPRSKRFYNKNKQPKMIQLTDQTGAGLIISNNSDPKTGVEANVSLRSAVGGSLSITDNPAHRGVIIKTNDSDMISIISQSDTQQNYSIKSECAGWQVHTSRAGRYNVNVVDGEDINIENTSTGVNKSEGTDEFPRAGNINILSKNHGITLHADADNAILENYPNSGRIWITSKKNTIQIRTGKDVEIYADGNISLLTHQNFNLKADGQINIEGSEVNIKSTSKTELAVGGAFKVIATANAEINGATVQLNKPGAVASFRGVDIPPAQTDSYNRQ